MFHARRRQQGDFRWGNDDLHARTRTHVHTRAFIFFLLVRGIKRYNSFLGVTGASFLIQELRGKFSLSFLCRKQVR